MKHLLITIVLTLATSALADTVVMDNVRIVDVQADQVSGPSAVLIRQGFIQESGPSGAFSDITDASRIDGQGRYLMPGLAEMHAHVPGDSDPRYQQDILLLYLAHGVTTIRGMLGQPSHLDLRRDLAAGRVTGPRLVTSGPSFNGNSVSSAESAAAMVRAQAEAGYDFLKLHPGLWPEAFEAITRTADALGIGFAGHVSDDVGIDRAIAARQSSVDHLDAYMQALVPESHELYGTNPEFFGINLALAADHARIAGLAQRTAEAGVWNVPTETLAYNIASERSLAEMMNRPQMAYMSPGTRSQWQQRVQASRAQYSSEQRQAFIDVRLSLIKALHDAGAGLLLGADAPQIMNVPGHAVHEELALYVMAGLTPAEALVTGTVNVGRFLGQPAYGCIAPGCVADLILLEGNPLLDIANTETLQGVMRAGQWFDRQTLDGWLTGIAERAATRD